MQIEVNGYSSILLITSIHLFVFIFLYLPIWITNNKSSNSYQLGKTMNSSRSVIVWQNEMIHNYPEDCLHSWIHQHDQ